MRRKEVIFTVRFSLTEVKDFINRELGHLLYINGYSPIGMQCEIETSKISTNIVYFTIRVLAYKREDI